MRNGKALLTQTLKAVACTFCLFAWCAGPVAAAEPEGTDSGAPTAMVMFPLSGKATAGSMRPVVFNHLIHERAVSDCVTCHHTGDPQPCSDCHTLTGSPEGGNVTLERAMHAQKIAPRAKGNTPASCVSCHDQRVLQKQECAGCHSIVTPARDDKWCAVCHNARVTPEQQAAGMAGSLTAEQTKAIVEKSAKKPAKELGYFEPTKVRIDTLAKDYEPCLFNHRRHVASVAERIGEDKLAKAFHYKKEILCATCHHHSPLSMTPPRCGSCHKTAIDPKDPSRPSLKAAYHLQCMGCHDGMNVQRPVKTDCTACHKEAAAK